MPLRIALMTSALLLVGLLGYRVGVSERPPAFVPPHRVQLRRVQVSQIRPAALYVRTPAGTEQRYAMEEGNPDWAQALQEHPGGRWNLELTTSPECPHRYRLETAMEQPE